MVKLFYSLRHLLFEWSDTKPHWPIWNTGSDGEHACEKCAWTKYGSEVVDW